MVFSRLILRFIIYKEGKIPNPKKVQIIVNMLVLISPQHIQVFNGVA
jgi:hypothetical protein